jgi:hypothetical protein
VTIVVPDGTAAAHGCAAGHHSYQANTDISGGNRDGPRLGADFLSGLGVKLTPIARGPCDHSAAEPGYVPSRKLAHLIRARNQRCTAPHCGQPAASCDLDHTFPWHLGGITCECDLAPLCRHHHRCKQSEGWWLEQPAPGVLRWQTPSGRQYTTHPVTYSL